MNDGIVKELVAQHSKNISMLQGQVMVHQAAIAAIFRVLSDQQRGSVLEALQADVENLLESLDQKPVSAEIRGSVSLSASALLRQLRPQRPR